MLLGDSDEIELVGVVENGEQAIEAAQRLDPEVVLMDVRLPGIDGISAVKRIHGAVPSVQFVMFSAYGDKRLLTDGIQAGARGYVMKGAPPEDLIRAIKTVASGKPFIDPALSPALIMTDTTGEGANLLSEREREIVQLLAEGHHTEVIANRIGLSVETVKSDTKRVIGKLQADTRTHAVAIALRQSLID